MGRELWWFRAWPFGIDSRLVVQLNSALHARKTGRAWRAGKDLKEGRVRSGSAGESTKTCSKNLDEAPGSPDVGTQASSRFLHHKLTGFAWLAGGQCMAVLACTRRGNEERERIAASQATPIRSEEKGEEPTWLGRLSSTRRTGRRQNERLALVALETVRRPIPPA